MAHFVNLKSGNFDVIVNIDNVDFIKSYGQTCALHFGGGQELTIDASAHATFGMMQAAKRAPKGD
jgi:hypothetical protein